MQNAIHDVLRNYEKRHDAARDFVESYHPEYVMKKQEAEWRERQFVDAETQAQWDKIEKEWIDTLNAELKEAADAEMELLKPSEQHIVDAEMAKRGFKRVGKNDYVSKDYIIKDLHPENIIVTKQKNFRFIDTNPMLNTPEAGYGGKREYGKDSEAEVSKNKGDGGDKGQATGDTQKRTGTPPEIATTLEEAKKKPVSVHDIAKFINQVFSVPVRRKLIGTEKNVLGFYKVGPEVIRLKNTNDIGTLMHELAHHIDKKNKLDGNWPQNAISELKKLDYDQKKQRPFEGFAEFVRKWMTGDGDLKKEAPNFLDWWENDFLKRKDGMGEQLKQVKQFVDIWREQGAYARVLGNIDSKPGLDKEATAFSKATKQIGKNIDANYIFRAFTNKILELKGMSRAEYQKDAAWKD